MIRSIEGEMVEQKVNNDLLYRSFPPQAEKEVEVGAWWVKNNKLKSTTQEKLNSSTVA